MGHRKHLRAAETGQHKISKHCRAQTSRRVSNRDSGYEDNNRYHNVRSALEGQTSSLAPREPQGYECCGDDVEELLELGNCSSLVPIPWNRTCEDDQSCQCPCGEAVLTTLRKQRSTTKGRLQGFTKSEMKKSTDDGEDDVERRRGGEELASRT